MVPLDDSEAAITAAQDANDHMLGQFADPVCTSEFDLADADHGHFPESMYKRFDRTKLDFSPDEWAIIKGSNDL